MKRSVFLSASLVSIMLLFVLSGCYKDIISPGQDPDGPPQFVSFSGDLVPLFSKNCALSGCHSTGAHLPDLTPAKAFSSLSAGGFVNVLLPAKSAIYTVASPGGAMPTLNPPDLQKLLDWIRNGAPNN